MQTALRWCWVVLVSFSDAGPRPASRLTPTAASSNIYQNGAKPPTGIEPATARLRRGWSATGLQRHGRRAQGLETALRCGGSGQFGRCGP